MRDELPNMTPRRALLRGISVGFVVGTGFMWASLSSQMHFAAINAAMHFVVGGLLLSTAIARTKP